MGKVLSLLLTMLFSVLYGDKDVPNENKQVIKSKFDAAGITEIEYSNPLLQIMYVK